MKKKIEKFYESLTNAEEMSFSELSESIGTGLLTCPEMFIDASSGTEVQGRIMRNASQIIVIIRQTSKGIQLFLLVLIFRRFKYELL